ncbi:hypothetical protein [Nocardia sp. NPDC059239]|uniref:hypothetical protein n=1 Tax=Actinomycetes TaxID=1760 RepID=UPI00368870E3
MKKPVKVKADKGKKPKPKATSKPPVPEFYLHDSPAESGRASISIHHENGKTTAQGELPARHLPSATGLIVGTLATATPAAVFGFACYEEFPVPATIAVTAMMLVVSVLAFAWLFYMTRMHRAPAATP